MIIELIKKAALYASNAHKDQLRKYTFEPYIVHPNNVINILKDAGVTNENMLCAAYLHDTVEDCGVTFEDIQQEFNAEISGLVYYLTDISKKEDGNRATRKRIDREHILKGPVESVTIKLADLIDNTSSISKHDPGFARKYLAEKEQILLGIKSIILPNVTDKHNYFYELYYDAWSIYYKAYQKAWHPYNLKTEKEF